MKQDYFERNQVHPFVASLLRRDGWVYHHEYAFEDRTRADFVAIQKRTGRVAVIECKVSVRATDDLIEQVNHYHNQFGYRHALKWVFIWNTPHSGTIKRLADHKIVTFPLENEIEIEPVEIGLASRLKFATAFARLKPLLQEMDNLEKRRHDLIARIASIYPRPAHDAPAQERYDG